MLVRVFLHSGMKSFGGQQHNVKALLFLHGALDALIDGLDWYAVKHATVDEVFFIMLHARQNDRDGHRAKDVVTEFRVAFGFFKVFDAVSHRVVVGHTNKQVSF